MRDAGTVSLDLAPSARSTAHARHFVVDTLRAWGCDAMAETAALLTSELVTNAILHARTMIQVSVHRLSDGVQVDVTDSSIAVPVRRPASQDATTGRGLTLLDRLATAWRIEPRSDGKTVSFRLANETPVDRSRGWREGTAQ
jgi:anti-sigma regulatory factor (Ser/Thr protein kinase)